MSQIIYQGELPYTSKIVFFYILYPLSLLKKAYCLIFDYFFDILADELLKGENDWDQLTNIIAFIGVSIFSLIIYHIQDFDDYILLSFIFIWFLDYLWHRRVYLRQEKSHQIIIKSLNDEDTTIEMISKTGKKDHLTQFKHYELAHISIQKTIIKGGAFDSKLAVIFRVFFRLKSSSTILISEDNQLNKSIQTAVKCASYYDVPWSVDDSKCFISPERYIEINKGLPDEIKHQNISFDSQEKSVNGFKFKTKTTFKNIKEVIKKGLKDSGLFLFVLITLSLLSRFGALIDFLIMRQLGISSSVVITISPQSLINLFMPDPSLIDYVEYLIALMIIIIMSVFHLKKKTIKIINGELKVYDGIFLSGSIKIEKITLLAKIDGEYASVVISNLQNSLEINNFVSNEEALRFCSTLTFFIKNSQNLHSR